MSTQVSEREAAIVSAAVLAFLSQPETISAAVTSPELPDHVGKMITELGEELKERIRVVEERVVRLEETVNAMMSRIEMIARMAASPKKSAALHRTPVRSACSFAERSELDLNRDAVRHVSKTTSLWSLAGRYTAMNRLGVKGRR